MRVTVLVGVRVLVAGRTVAVVNAVGVIALVSVGEGVAVTVKLPVPSPLNTKRPSEPVRMRFVSPPKRGLSGAGDAAPSDTSTALTGLPLRTTDLALPDLPDATDLRRFARPVLLLSGENDRYCPGEALRGYARAFPNATVEVVAGTDHYFWRHERLAAKVVGAFAERVLGD